MYIHTCHFLLVSVCHRTETKMRETGGGGEGGGLMCMGIFLSFFSFILIGFLSSHGSMSRVTSVSV